MDDIGDSLRESILNENVALLLSNKIQPSALPNGLIPVDIDVTPMDNSKSKKEGVSRTYKGFHYPWRTVRMFIIWHFYMI